MLSAVLKQLAAKEALDFLARLSIDVQPGSPEAVQLELFAEQEFADAKPRALTVLVDKAVAMVRAVRAAVESGEIPAEWDRNDRMQQLVTTGLKQYDPRVAFQATLRSSYSAGRYQRGMDDQADQEYWLYRTMNDSRVRTSHQILNGVYLPKANAFWGDHFPPNGWRCRCKAVSMSQRTIDRLVKAGVPLQAEAPEEKMVTYKDKVTGKDYQLPQSIEPGWDYNPGTPEGSKRLAEQLKRRMDLLDALATRDV